MQRSAKLLLELFFFFLAVCCRPDVASTVRSARDLLHCESTAVLAECCCQSPEINKTVEFINGNSMNFSKFYKQTRKS